MKFHLLVLPLALLAPSPVHVQSRPAEEACKLERSGAASGKSADICRHVGERWTALFGTSPIPGTIRLSTRDGYHLTQTDASWSLEFPFSPRQRPESEYRPADGLLRYYADNIIPHEAGHGAFAASVGARRFGVSPNQYATQLPDWFEEGVAVWMESAAMRSKRMQTIRHKSPSLQRIATLEHPHIDQVNASTDFRVSERTVLPPCAKCTFLPESLRRKFQIMDSGTDAKGQPKSVTWYSDKAPSKADTFEEREFYPLAYSLLRFIRIKGGSLAVRELLARLQVNPTPRVEVLSALPGLPASVAAFENAWHEFLASMPAESK